MKIRVLVADDHAIFRAGVVALLERDGAVKVVAEAGSGPELLEAARGADFDVLTLDLSMPEARAPELLAQVRAMRPRSKTVVLTMHEDPFYLHEMLKAGAQGYVVKKSSGHCLLEAIRQVHQGSRYIDPSLAGAVLAPSKDALRPAANSAAALTSREREVCALLAKGHTNAEVGELLFISARTVESHRNNLMAKLGLKSRAELVRFAVSQQMLTFVNSGPAGPHP